VGKKIDCSMQRQKKKKEEKMGFGNEIEGERKKEEPAFERPGIQAKW